MLEKILSVVFVVALVVLPQPAIAQPDGSSSSQLVGAVYGAHGEGPATGARVLAFHLATERVYTSEAIDARGHFSLTELPHGYFDLAVETAGGLFVADQVVRLPPGTMGVVSMMLDRDDSEEVERLAFAGATVKPAGTATLRQHAKPAGKGFLRGPMGISLISGGGLLTLLALSGDGGGSGSASPHAPD